MTDSISVDGPYSQSPDDYELGPAIGFGSSAIVYIATYLPFRTKVAIKMIELDRFERNQIDELRKEILVMNLCHHENLLEVLASFVNDSKLWIVTPYMAIGSCLDLLKNYFKEGMEEKYIQVILYQTLLGLDYLHRNGHIHRDVKAGNLLIRADGVIKLADFGVTSSLMEDTQKRGSLRKTFVGTPCWMAPEVMEMTKGYNSKADIWSLGITALELAYGSAPLSKYPPMKVIYMTLSNSSHLYLDRSRTRFKYSKAFKAMIDECLQRDPAKRPSAECLLKHLFFKPVRKAWQSSHIESMVVEKNVTMITGGSLRLKELVASFPGVHERAALLDIPCQTVNTHVASEDGEDFASGMEESQSSWDFDEQSSVEDAVHKSLSFNDVQGPSSDAPRTLLSSNSSELYREDSISGGAAQAALVSEIKKGRFSVVDSNTQGSQVGSPAVPTVSVTNTPATTLASSPIDPQVLQNLSLSEDQGPPRNPGVTLEKKGSRFKITNEHFVASLALAPNLPPIADLLKSLKDLERVLVALYEDNDALRRNLAALQQQQQQYSAAPQSSSSLLSSGSQSAAHSSTVSSSAQAFRQEPA